MGRGRAGSALRRSYARYYASEAQTRSAGPAAPAWLQLPEPAGPMGPCRRSAVRPHHARRLLPVPSSWHQHTLPQCHTGGPAAARGAGPLRRESAPSSAGRAAALRPARASQSSRSRPRAGSSASSASPAGRRTGFNSIASGRRWCRLPARCAWCGLVTALGCCRPIWQLWVKVGPLADIQNANKKLIP